MRKENAIIGILSDTHGLLRKSALGELKGADLIVHAGDFDTPEVLAALQKIAPVLAARGNMDRGGWAKNIPVWDVADFDHKTICVIHDLHHLSLDPAAAGIGIVVSGHSHQPGIARQKGVLYINPGSAGPRRLRNPISMARLIIQDGRLDPEIIYLDG